MPFPVAAVAGGLASGVGSSLLGGGGKGGGGKGGGGFDFPAAPDIRALAEEDVTLRRGLARENLLLANPNSVGPFGTTTFDVNPQTGQGTITSRPLPGVEKLINQQVGQRLQFADLAAQAFRANDSILRQDLDEEGIEELIDIKGGLPPILTGFNDGLGLGRIDVNDTRFAPDLLDAINVQGLASIPGLEEFRDLAQEAEDAAFNSFARRFDPLEVERFEALEQDLANRGLPVGGDAQREALRQFRDDSSTARLQAADRAFLTGEQVASQRLRDFLLGQGQDFGQRQAQGQFTNAARLAEAQNRLGVAQINDARAINEANFSNAGRAQAFAQAQGMQNQALNITRGLAGDAAAFLPTPQGIGFQPVVIQPPPSFVESGLGLFGLQSQNAATVGQANQAAKSGGLDALSSLGSAAIGAEF